MPALLGDRYFQRVRLARSGSSSLRSPRPMQASIVGSGTRQPYGIQHQARVPGAGGREVGNSGLAGGRVQCVVSGIRPPIGVVEGCRQAWGPTLSVPKRLRWHLEREPKAVTAVLHIFLRVVEAHLRKSGPGPSAQARFGAGRRGRRSRSRGGGIRAHPTRRRALRRRVMAPSDRPRGGLVVMEP